MPLKKILANYKLISVVIFVISLFVTPFYIDAGGFYTLELDFDFYNIKYGIFLLLFGWMYLLNFGGLGFIWLANPILFVSWLTSNKKLSVILALVASLLALSFVLFGDIVIADERGYILPDNTEGALDYAKLNLSGFGYWVWTLSVLLNSGGSIALYLNKTNTKKIWFG